MVIVAFKPGEKEISKYEELDQYDYGQILRIQGLHLPPAVEIHFALQKTGGTSKTRIGITKDGVTDVPIPDSMLENEDETKDYDIYAFIYITDETSGQTEYRITLKVKARPKPEAFDRPEDAEIFKEAIKAVNESAARSAESEKQAEGWAHGREDLPERLQDNAKYYSEQAREDSAKTDADRKEVRRLVESVSGIGEQVEKVEGLTKQAQTSATNAALSEQATKESENNAAQARAGAEVAEDNAELAAQRAEQDKAIVEQAKNIVKQMGQEVLDNKNLVDKTTQDFDLKAQQALADVNNAGQAQTERVQTAGNAAIESVKTAQSTATRAVETAKTEAIKAVQAEGTTQVGNVSAEGEKQVQAVQGAAQEIVADREQIAKNATDIADLKQGKADAIVETASDTLLNIRDGADAFFEDFKLFGKTVQDGTPTPDAPVPVTNVGEKGTIEIKVTGKNLIPFPYKLVPVGNKGTKNGITWEVLVDGGIRIEGTANPETFYLELDNNLKIGDTLIEPNNTDGNIATNKDVTYDGRLPKTYIVVNKGERVNRIYYPQIERGTIATEYELYKEQQVLTLQTPNDLSGIKVDKDGNYTDKNGQHWRTDEIDLARGKYVQRIKKKIFDGTETWYTWGCNANGNIGFYMYPNVANDVNNVEYGKCICNYLPYNSGVYNGEKIGVNIIQSTNYTVYYIVFSMKQSDLKDVSTNELAIQSFKEFLSTKKEEGNPVEVYCKLFTYIERDLTPEEIAAFKTLHTNYPTTIIENDENAGMEVSYIADTKLYIDKKFEELNQAIINTQISLL